MHLAKSMAGVECVQYANLLSEYQAMSARNVLNSIGWLLEGAAGLSKAWLAAAGVWDVGLDRQAPGSLAKASEGLAWHLRRMPLQLEALSVLALLF